MVIVSDLLAQLGLSGLMTPTRVAALVRALLVLALGLLLTRIVVGAIRRAVADHLREQHTMLVSRISYVILLLIVVSATLHQLGFQLGVVLGAAGVLSVALGFASQTAASNLISGAFLIAEEPFQLGDVIEVEGIVGQVHAIDVLSVKLRKFDNTVVRIPNELLIKTPVVNRSKFPIRRLDLQIGVAYKEDTERVRRILLDVADVNPLVLEEPEPVFIHKGYGDSALELQFSVWSTQENFGELYRYFREEVKTAFDANGIEIPFPHRSLYTGSVTEPFPIRLVDDRSAPAQRDALTD
jgi:small-conductance mechanosensitive channel